MFKKHHIYIHTHTYIYIYRSISVNRYIYIFIYLFLISYIYNIIYITSYIIIFILIYTYIIYLYTYMRIECRLRTIVYSHIIRHSRIQCQRGISNWPLWLKTHCSTRTKNCHAEAAIRVKPSPKHLLQYQVPEHNRTGNPRFSGYQP